MCRSWNKTPQIGTSTSSGKQSVLLTAAALGSVGRYQLEAAIQSAHTAGRFEGTTNWAAVVQLYDQLEELTGSVVVGVNRCAAIVNTLGAHAALQALDAIAHDGRLQRYQPYWATRAHLLEIASRSAEAREASSSRCRAECPNPRRAFRFRAPHVIQAGNEIAHLQLVLVLHGRRKREWFIVQ